MKYLPKDFHGTSGIMFGLAGIVAMLALTLLFNFSLNLSPNSFLNSDSFFYFYPMLCVIGLAFGVLAFRKKNRIGKILGIAAIISSTGLLFLGLLGYFFVGLTQ